MLKRQLRRLKISGVAMLLVAASFVTLGTQVANAACDSYKIYPVTSRSYYFCSLINSSGGYCNYDCTYEVMLLPLIT